MVEFLDYRLQVLDQTIQRELGVSVAEVPGSGAAGAFGAGILAFLKGKLCPGIEAVLDLVKFDEKLTDATSFSPARAGSTARASAARSSAA